MRTTDEIRELIERFYDGMTDEAEEKWLKTYFSPTNRYPPQSALDSGHSGQPDSTFQRWNFHLSSGKRSPVDPHRANRHLR